MDAAMKRWACMALAVGACATGSTWAGDIDQIQLLNQQEFRLLSEDLGAALSYKPLSPAEPLGFPGFDVGVAVTATKLQNTDLFKRASSSGDFPSYAPVPSLRAAVGLPFGFDVGASFAAMPGTNVSYYGGELKWAFVPGNTLIPAVGVRGAFTKLSGVDQLDFSTKSVDVSISKGFLVFTPYAGIGQVWVDATAKGIGNLGKESFNLSKIFAGVNINLGLVNLAIEADKTGDATSAGAKVGFRF